MGREFTQSTLGSNYDVQSKSVAVDEVVPIWLTTSAAHQIVSRRDVHIKFLPRARLHNYNAAHLRGIGPYNAHHPPYNACNTNPRGVFEQEMI